MTIILSIISAPLLSGFIEPTLGTAHCLFQLAFLAVQLQTLLDRLDICDRETWTYAGARVCSDKSILSRLLWT
jgi:hypothetical protein